MAKLVAFYSRADENYFGGSMKYIQTGNTEKAAKRWVGVTISSQTACNHSHRRITFSAHASA